MDASGTINAKYTYNAWGEDIDTTAAVSNIETINPLRYHGYYYDSETKLYYLQSRYYDPVVCRFINADDFTATGQGFLGYNTYAYCANNPVTRADAGGVFWDTVFDVVSLVVSVAQVIENPKSGEAWASLAADVVCLAVPGLTGGGTVVKAVTKADDAADAVKTITRFADDVIENGFDVGRVATSGSPNRIGKVGEMLAGIDPSAKTKIFVNGRSRIPDGLTPTVLTEVKNVKYISNTQQLRDFADYASLTGRSLELYVRPTTKIAKTVTDAGWNIKYLW